MSLFIRSLNEGRELTYNKTGVVLEGRAMTGGLFFVGSQNEISSKKPREDSSREKKHILS